MQLPDYHEIIERLMDSRTVRKKLGEGHYSNLDEFQSIIEHGALPCLLNLLTHNHKRSIKKKACWTISNITAGNKEQLQVLLRE
ncbi:importin subunit alpha-1b-like [Camellia sinensis]|uniref:importin subunit alpha-1b-like n=1 Tax=Camellia sinensis TaxID=4442 RepID=UPI0010367105|nr:importin subunit alpha-1b-like [Camellia sinensis]XP_028056544.1 importin subunit alpha-1b-like [Camellia sinensis]